MPHVTPLLVAFRTPGASPQHPDDSSPHLGTDQTLETSGSYMIRELTVRQAVHLAQGPASGGTVTDHEFLARRVRGHVIGVN